MSHNEKVRALLADEERAKIIRKASEDVDNFINSLPKKKYEDGWSEDKWEEEVEKHPLFMSKIDESQELPPLVEAFQSLKYDIEINDPVDVAKAHKEDGNEQFKKNKHKLAVAAYSEGLKINCNDIELNTVLHCNRAAAFYHMGNYKKSLEDAMAAKALKANHIKAIHRGALCNFKLGNYKECIAWCKDGIKLNNIDTKKALLDLEKNAKDHIKRQEDSKRQALAEKSELDSLTKAVKARGINIVKKGFTPESILCDFPGTPARLEMVDGELIWPIVFLYPQYGVTDFVPNFNENASFYDYFCELFKEHPDWDLEKEYTADNVKVYFCDKNGIIYPVAVKQPLKSAMCHETFIVTHGTLEFYVTSSEFDKIYRTQNYVIEI